jgi:PAS domain S-box-containing protein
MKTVLIVDDSADSLYLLEVILRRKGLDVVTAANGSEALESALKAPPDLVISDILMPVMDGFNLRRKWKADEKLKHIPFIFYTATYTEAKDERFALSLGADRFILKPQEPETLMNMLAEFLEKKPAQSFSPPVKPLGEEVESFRQYNEVLFNKLEKKMLDLEIANRKLKPAEEKYLKLADALPQTIVEFDERGNFTYVNRNGFETFGYTREDFDKGLNVFQTIIPGDLDRARENIQRVLRGEKGTDNKYMAMRKDGSAFPVIACTSVITHNNKPVGLRGIIVDITSRKQAEESLKQTLEKLRKSLAGTIQAMSLTVETRDPYTAGHQRRVSNLACAIAQEMGLSNDTIDNIRMAGIIHDIGKISVPAEILAKPTKLTDIEMGLIKVHSQAGYDILKDVELPYPIAEMVLQHHERLNGSGYPQGLKGDQILLETKILSVADVTEAIATHRPYRPALGIDAAIEEIEKNKGILYDAEVVEVCLKLFREGGFKLE